jgi:very-short-patch-repair endonuclease
MIPLHFDGKAFTSRQARAAGMSRRQLTGLVAVGRVRRMLHDVYVDATVPDTVELRCEGVALVLPPAAVVCRRTAAWLFGFDAYAPDQRDECLVVECVVPARLARVRRDGVRGDDFCHRGLTTVPQLSACAERFAGGRNIAIARRLIRWAEPLTESPGESWLRLRILDAGFPRPDAQVRILDASGRLVYRLDLGYRELRLGLEYDGQEFHDSAEDREHDARRRQRLDREFGWETHGFGRGDVLGRVPTVELVVGGLLGLEPRLPRRR